MNKEKYEAKLATTIITDNNTVGEAKAAKKVENELKRFWKKEALAFILETEGKDLMAPNWTIIDWKFDLKPGGSIVIKETPYTEFGREAGGKEYRILKRNLFK